MRSAQRQGNGVENAAVDSADRRFQHRNPPAKAAACRAPPAIGRCSLWHSMARSRPSSDEAELWRQKGQTRSQCIKVKCCQQEGKAIEATQRDLACAPV